MKAVNLIPAREPGTPAGGQHAYVLLGVLGLLVALLTLWTLTTKSVDDKRAELAAVTAEVKVAESKAGALKRFTEFSSLRKARVETVKSLVDSRVDWSYALREVARTLPSGSWATSLRATTSPTTAVEGSTDAMRAAVAAPAIEMAGCAADQEGVAETIASLRRISGVQRVSLSSATRADGSGTGDATAAQQSTGCGSHAQFSLTVFFEATQSPTAQPTPAATAGGSTP